MGASRNRIGTYFLIGALAGFLFVSFQPWIPLGSVILFQGLSLKRLLAAFFDAALVGALADWFAVTALFRSPLGVKLPHTNILAKNKDAIAEAVPRFLSGFVSDERIRVELGNFDYASRLEGLLDSGGVRESLHGYLRTKLSLWLSGCATGPENRIVPIRDTVADLCSFASENLDPGPAFAGLIRWAHDEGFDDRVISGIADVLRSEIGKNRAYLAAAITPIVKRNAGWKGLFIGKGTMEELLRGIEEELASLSSDRNHELRAFLVKSLTRYADTLAGDIADPAGDRETFAQGVRDALRDPSFTRGLADFVADLLRRLGLDLSGDRSRFIEGLSHLEDGLIDRLGQDALFRERVNEGLGSLLASLITRIRLVDSLSDYMAGLLKATDAREFVDRIEDSVWNDLQYIRVNGAVVGGLVGLILSVLSAFFPA